MKSSTRFGCRRLSVHQRATSELPGQAPVSAYPAELPSCPVALRLLRHLQTCSEWCQQYQQHSRRFVQSGEVAIYLVRQRDHRWLDVAVAVLFDSQRQVLSGERPCNVFAFVNHKRRAGFWSRPELTRLRHPLPRISPVCGWIRYRPP